MSTPAASPRLRFGQFELDLGAYRLTHAGQPVRLEQQPMDLLILLVQRRPHLVTREEIIERVAALDIGKAEVVCCVRLPGCRTALRMRTTASLIVAALVGA